MLISFRKSVSGFTIIELLVVLAIIAILTSVGVPSYNKFVESGRFSHAYNNLYNSYRFARAEAIKTSTPMVIKAKGGDWHTGWTVAAESAPNTILLDSPEVKSGITLTILANTLTITGRGSVSAASTTLWQVAGVNKTQKLCILRSGQSYKKLTAGNCP